MDDDDEFMAAAQAAEDEMKDGRSARKRRRRPKKKVVEAKMPQCIIPATARRTQKVWVVDAAPDHTEDSPKFEVFEGKFGTKLATSSKYDCNVWFNDESEDRPYPCAYYRTQVFTTKRRAESALKIFTEMGPLHSSDDSDSEQDDEDE